MHRIQKELVLRCVHFAEFLGLLLLIAVTGCSPTKYSRYFEDFSDTSKPLLLPANDFQSPKIQPDDLLAVNILTLNSESNLLFAKQSSPLINPSSSNISGGQVPSASQQANNGYLVDKNGNIDIPIIGIVHVEGLTTIDARDTVKSFINKFYSNATVEVKFINYKITILGEVNHPASYVMPNEKVTVFDAIGLAGDMTIYGKKENILLIRDSANQKKLVRLNLSSKAFVNSYYFYLKQNDVLYVDANESKIKSLDAYRIRNYGIGAALLSLLIVIATRIK
jgi:polysaccharide export outer membrane protein